MEGTCNECVFPLNMEASAMTCPTDTSLIYAVGQGKLACVKELIAGGADVNTSCECHGEGALHAAAIQGHVGCTKELINAGADVNIKDRDGHTPVMFASVECLNELITAGVDVNMKDKLGKTALMYGIERGGIDHVKLIIGAGADVNTENKSKKARLTTALMVAARTGKTICMKELLKAGAKLNVANYEGATALVLAIENRHHECVTELIAAGAGVNIGTPSPLMITIQEENLYCLKELLKAGADVNMGRIPPLITAAQQGNIDCAKELLKFGADVDVVDGAGDSALIQAVDLDNEAIVELLVENGAIVNTRNKSGETALYLALTNAQAEYAGGRQEVTGGENPQYSIHTRMVFALLKVGAHLNDLKPNQSQLNPIKVNRLNSYIIKMLSTAGADIETTDEFQLDINLQDLTRDALRKHLKKIRPETNLYYTISLLGLPHKLQAYLLLDVLPQDSQFLNISEKELLLKSSEGDVDSVLKLIQAGVDVNVQDKDGMTALMLASQKGHVDVIVELFKTEVNINAQALHGNSALIYAVGNGQNECVKKLLELGSNIDMKGQYGDTALMQAAKNGNEECLQMLIDAGADPNVQNDDDDAAKSVYRDDGEFWFSNEHKGTTALVYAAYQGNVDCVRRLIRAGADVNNDSKSNGNTPLVAAVTTQNIEGVKELIKAGSDLNIPDSDGKTALMIASTQGKDSCFTTLIKAGAEISPGFIGDAARNLLVSEDSGGD